jgi:hypothetical protein
METSSETVSEDREVSMGHRIPNYGEVRKEMASERQQDEPTPIRPQQESQGSSNPSQDVPPSTIVIPISPQSPQPPYRKKKTGHKGAECRDRWRLGVEIVALFVGAIGLYALIQTLSETRKATDAATTAAIATKLAADAAVAQSKVSTDALYSQRPYVSLGRADGTIVEYIPPQPGEREGMMLLYVQNTGPAPALSFLINVYSDLFSGPRIYRHIVRYRQVDEQGKVAGYPIFPNAMIGSDSTHVVVVDPESVPYDDEWELIKSDKGRARFALRGNLEYCDQWGKYHCAEFEIHYQPSPVRRFVANSHECLPEFPSLLKESDIIHGENVRIKLLPRCEQPDERQAEENKQ